jgi:hypothetical protein
MRTHFLSTLSHLEIVAHMPENLLLLSMGMKTLFFTPTPQQMGMVMATTENGHGKWYRQEKCRKPLEYRCNKGINLVLL